MRSPVTYRGFWGMRSGQALEAFVDFLCWQKSDWVEFEKFLDYLEQEGSKQAQSSTKRVLWRQTVHSLRKRRAFLTKKLGDRVVIRLTAKGKRAVYVYRLKNNRTQSKLGWCIVVFDFPESQHHARDVFRRFLFDAGFDRLQQSVFVTSRDVAEEMRFIIDDLGLAPWVTIFDGRLVGGEMMVEVPRNRRPLPKSRGRD